MDIPPSIRPTSLDSFANNNLNVEQEESKTGDPFISSQNFNLKQNGLTPKNIALGLLSTGAAYKGYQRLKKKTNDRKTKSTTNKNKYLKTRKEKDNIPPYDFDPTSTKFHSNPYLSENGVFNSQPFQTQSQLPSAHYMQAPTTPQYLPGVPMTTTTPTPQYLPGVPRITTTPQYLPGVPTTTTTPTPLYLPGVPTTTTYLQTPLNGQTNVTYPSFGFTSPREQPMISYNQENDNMMRHQKDETTKNPVVSLIEFVLNFFQSKKNWIITGTAVATISYFFKEFYQKAQKSHNKSWQSIAAEIFTEIFEKPNALYGNYFGINDEHENEDTHHRGGSKFTKKKYKTKKNMINDGKQSLKKIPNRKKKEGSLNRKLLLQIQKHLEEHVKQEDLNKLSTPERGKRRKAATTTRKIKRKN